VMNVIWMAVLGIVMALEKITQGNRLTYVTGAALMLRCAGFVLAGFAAHWPQHGI
jgi:predicted metal-binding membrane protein